MNSNPYIVAEISCNHRGVLDEALRLIEHAKWAGADAVKFQCWSPTRMCVDKSYVIPDGTWKGRKLYELYQEAYTPWEWFNALFFHADRLKIDCFSSVFDVEALAFLESLGCPRYKIASFEITDLPLIRAVAKTGKPIVISTGMASWDEIRKAVVATEQKATFLKCTSAYPASTAAANLETLVAMKYNTGTPVGVSDHTLGLAVPVAATALGATMIEKHLTLKRSNGGPDAAFSSEPEEFKAMVDACREAALAIGEVRYGPTKEEQSSLQFRRSLYWAKDINPGEIITEHHLVSSRPMQGVPPDAAVHLIGKIARRPGYANDPVTGSYDPVAGVWLR